MLDHRRLASLASFLIALGTSSTVFAQTISAEASCAPGQPCGGTVVIQEAPAPPVGQPSGTIVVQPAAPTAPPGYVVTQPAYAQPTYVVQQAPPRQAIERRSSRMRWAMVGPGIGLIIGGWVGNWLTGIVGTVDMAFSSSDDGGTYFGWSWIPWVGPYVNAAFYADSPDEGYLAMHLLFGVMQTAGLLLCILGTVLREETVTLEYALSDDPEAARLSVLPWASADGAGAMLSIRGF